MCYQNTKYKIHKKTINGQLINTLQNESEIVIDWFESNQMNVNPDKFQVIIFNKERKTDQNEYTLSFCQYTLKSKNIVTFLGIEIDDRLTFTAHIHSLTRKAAANSTT